jgi:peroxiredoxin
MIHVKKTLVFTAFILFLSSSLRLEGATLNEKRLAPDFSLQDLNKNTVTLSAYRDKNAVILFFWTTWCPYCRSELKQLNQLYPTLLNQGIELFAVDVAEFSYRVENFVERYNLSLRVLLDKDAAVAEAFSVLGVPTYVILNKKGEIVFEGNYFPQRQYNEIIAR